MSLKHLSRPWRSCRIIRIAAFPLSWVLLQCYTQTIDQGINTQLCLDCSTSGNHKMQKLIFSRPTVHNNIESTIFFGHSLGQTDTILTKPSFLQIPEPINGQRACVHTTAHVPCFSWIWKFTRRGNQTFRFQVCLYLRAACLPACLQQSFNYALE